MLGKLVRCAQRLGQVAEVCNAADGGGPKFWGTGVMGVAPRKGTVLLENKEMSHAAEVLVALLRLQEALIESLQMLVPLVA